MQMHYLAPKLTKRSLSNFSTDFKDSIEPEICNIINNFNINNMTSWKFEIKSHLNGMCGRWCVNSCRSVIFNTAESTNRWICRETVELKLNKLFLLLNKWGETMKSRVQPSCGLCYKTRHGYNKSTLCLHVSELFKWAQLDRPEFWWPIVARWLIGEMQIHVRKGISWQEVESQKVIGSIPGAYIEIVILKSGLFKFTCMILLVDYKSVSNLMD